MILPDIVSAGIFNSQISKRGKEVTKNRKPEMFEFELPIEDGGISYINSEQTNISPNVIICAKPGQTRHTKLPYKCYYVHIILKSGTLYNTLMNVAEFVETENNQRYKEIFVNICKYYDSSIENDKIILQSLILELIYNLSIDSKKQSNKGKTVNRNYEMIEKVVKYIKINISEDLSLEKVAEYVNLSPIHFHNSFKNAMGKTLHEYVEEQRIKKASNLLVTTDWTLTRISGECGFSSQSYFSYAFKRKMNLTPREYAKEIFERYMK